MGKQHELVVLVVAITLQLGQPPELRRLSAGKVFDAQIAHEPR